MYNVALICSNSRYKYIMRCFPCLQTDVWKSQSTFAASLIISQSHKYAQISPKVSLCVCGTNYTRSVYKTPSSFFTCLTHTFRLDTHKRPLPLSHPPLTRCLVSSHCFLFFPLIGVGACTCVSVRLSDTLLMEWCASDPLAVSGVPQHCSQHISHPKAALQPQNTHTYTHH